ncbi:MAG TPA: FadR/GntR family transcriptional regulator [Conexibacter sp.]|nr:FadR/GntR family transcriptional regulator [Conexibacter sp.]
MSGATAGVDDGSLRGRIERHVRELIETGAIAPGERLPTERELAERLGVSRVPIREAIRTLSTQGLVDVRGRQGMYVAARDVEATVDELTSALLRQRIAFDELFAVRQLLEPASARWAAEHADAEAIATLRGLIARMERATHADPPDNDTVRWCDNELHLALATASGNGLLRRVLASIQGLHSEHVADPRRFRGRAEGALEEHRRIVEAVAARDPQAAETAMAEHLSHVGRADAWRIADARQGG